MLLALRLSCSSHTDESMSKPSHTTQGIFTPDALPAATLPISGLGYWLGICRLAYPESSHRLRLTRLKL